VCGQLFTGSLGELAPLLLRHARAEGSGWTPVDSLIHTWAWSSKTQVTWSLAGYLLVVQIVSFSLWKILQKVGDTYITHVSCKRSALRPANLSPSTSARCYEAARFRQTRIF
jgi:hypothetical protein